MLANERKIPSIAQELGMDVSTIYNYASLYITDGAEGYLENHYRRVLKIHFFKKNDTVFRI